MVITGISRGISQLQISHSQEKDPPKRNFGHPKNSLAHSLRSCRIWMFFLRTVRLSLTWLEVFTQKKTWLIQNGSSPSLFRDQEIYHLSVLKCNPCQAALALQRCLRNLIPRNLVLEVFIRMALICGPETVFWDLPGAHRCIECLLLFFFFFHGLTHE